MANSTATDDGSRGSGGGMGSITLVILCAVIVSLFILAFLVYRLMVRNRWIVHHLPSAALQDPEAALSTRRPSNRPRAAAAPPFPIEKLDELAPAQPFTKWKNVTESGDPESLQCSTFLICVICLDPLDTQDTIRNLPCHHIFHAECIAKWFTTKHPTCPICKFDYQPPAADEVTPPPPVVTAATGATPDDVAQVAAAPAERPPNNTS